MGPHFLPANPGTASHVILSVASSTPLPCKCLGDVEDSPTGRQGDSRPAKATKREEDNTYHFDAGDFVEGQQELLLRLPLRPASLQAQDRRADARRRHHGGRIHREGEVCKRGVIRKGKKKKKTDGSLEGVALQSLPSLYSADAIATLVNGLSRCAPFLCAPWQLACSPHDAS